MAFGRKPSRFSLWLRMISAQTLRVCREGKPVPTFPDHALDGRCQTASLAALTGLARTILRAGFALNIISSPVNGLVPLRALVAGFLTTTNLANPGTRKMPVFLSSL